MVENLIADVEAVVAEAEAAGNAPAAVTLPAATLKRVQAMAQERDAALQKMLAAYQGEINKVLLYALEAMGVTGAIQNVDPETGVVTLVPAPKE